jgi:hypothetical protein
VAAPLGDVLFVTVGEGAARRGNSSAIKNAIPDRQRKRSTQRPRLAFCSRITRGRHYANVRNSSRSVVPGKPANLPVKEVTGSNFLPPRSVLPGEARPSAATRERFHWVQRARTILPATTAVPLAECGENADYLTARIARDCPKILARMKAGEFRSVRAAAIAGIVDEEARSPRRKKGGVWGQGAAKGGLPSGRWVGGWGRLPLLFSRTV